MSAGANLILIENSDFDAGSLARKCVRFGLRAAESYQHFARVWRVAC